MKRYSVWNNKTDSLVICDGSSKECALAMKIKPSNFRKIYFRSRNNQVKKWTIIECEPMSEEELIS